MDKQFPTGWVLAVWVLASYLLLGTLSAGGAAPPVLVLLLVLLLWFLVYAFRHRGLGNRELVRRMHADLEGTLEGLKERVAQQEASRLATLEHEEQTRLEQERRRAEGERRRATTPTRDPAVGTYADMIESRVRERERSGWGSEGP
jgi:hypothetical protein